MNVAFHLQSFSEIAVLILAALFGVAGLALLLFHGMIRRAEWGYPPRLYRIMGILQLLAATLIAIPATRFGGIGLAAMINFSAVVLLLKNRAWLVVLPGLVIAAVLLLFVPASQ